MSLISDALKKARQEAARQDALRQGVPYAIGAADAPVRRAPWLSLLAGLGAGCLLAGVVFALAYFAGWGPFRKGGVETRVAQAAQAPVPTVPQPSVTPPPVAEPAAPPVAPVVKPQEAPPPAAAVAPTIPKPEPPRKEPESAPVQPPPVRRPAPEPAAPAPIPTSEAEPLVPNPAPIAPALAPQPSPSGGLEEGKVYPGEVPVPGGGLLKLNGIAYSQDHPIAVLGGRVMGPGESVQGFTVVEFLSTK
jgi:hypothetical protein